MKRLKFTYSRTSSKKTNSNQKQQHLTNHQPKYNFEILKAQAMKSLYGLKSHQISKTEPYKYMTNTQLSFKTQHISRSEEKKGQFQKTISSSFRQTKQKDFKKQLSVNNFTSVNVKMMLRVKTELDEKENERILNNPFYKIQKLRAKRNKTNVEDENCNNEKLDPKTTQQKFIISNKLTKQQNANDLIFLARAEKHQYFEQKKVRFRMISHNQNISTIHLRKLNNAKIIQSSNKIQKSLQISTSLQSQQDGVMSGQKTLSILQFSKLQRIMYDTDVIVEESRQESPGRIRDKSLTIKYNQIKDYFQSKYSSKKTLVQESLEADCFDCNC